MEISFPYYVFSSVSTECIHAKIHPLSFIVLHSLLLLLLMVMLLLLMMWESIFLPFLATLYAFCLASGNWFWYATWYACVFASRRSWSWLACKVFLPLTPTFIEIVLLGSCSYVVHREMPTISQFHFRWNKIHLVYVRLFFLSLSDTLALL